MVSSSPALKVNLTLPETYNAQEGRLTMLTKLLRESAPVLNSLRE
jgi:hypothetical protein